MSTIVKPDFKAALAKILEEISAQTCVDEIEVEIIKEILQDELTEYHTVLDGYYEEEYYIAVSSARSKAYDDGHSDGYEDGYDAGVADCHAKNNYAV